jgi:uncharacterized protein (DUF1499 family)
MTAVLLQRESKQALWARRIAVFAAQVVIISVLLHRFDLLGTRVATILLGFGAFGGLLAIALAWIALVRIWRQGLLRGGHAIAGVVIGLALLAGPLWYLPDLVTRPKINDITTDSQSPPQFDQIAALRGKDSNPIVYPGAGLALKQMQAYPDIRPMVLERSAEETFDLAREAVTRLDWEVVSERKPSGHNSGHIEAVAKTLLMGFSDDIVIRVSSGVGEAKIDVRSASRYGEHDFGANAKRIRRLFTEVKAGLEKGERVALEVALTKRAKKTRDQAKQMRVLRAKAKRQEEARLAKLKEQARKEELKRLTELQQENLRIEQGLFRPRILGVPKPKKQPRARASSQDHYKFWEQFDR